jgi:hypothetical protein
MGSGETLRHSFRERTWEGADGLLLCATIAISARCGSCRSGKRGGYFQTGSSGTANSLSSTSLTTGVDDKAVQIKLLLPLWLARYYKRFLGRCSSGADCSYWRVVDVLTTATPTQTSSGLFE